MATAKKNTTTKKNVVTKKTATKKSAPVKKAPLKKAAAPAKKATTPTKKAAIPTKKAPAKKNAAKDLAGLFEDGLKDIYWAEKALTKALPTMHKNATNEDLKAGIASHLKETEGHVTRLEQIFESMGKKAQAKKCDAMAGLIEEGKSILQDTQAGTVRDAGIIAASQKIEHYEIATYGTLAAFAKVLKEEAALELLIKSLEEEKMCDQKLSSIADMALNAKAV